MTHKDKNYSYSQPVFANGDIILECNLSQAVPHTPIGAGVLGLRFEKCNLTNCALPITAAVNDNNNAQIDFCYWLHPELALPVEEANCRHVVSRDDLIIDGVVVDTFYAREDKDAA